MKAADPDWSGAVPTRMIVAPGGTVLFKGGGTLDIVKARRTTLTSSPDNDYVGQIADWNVAAGRRPHHHQSESSFGLKATSQRCPSGSWK